MMNIQIQTLFTKKNYNHNSYIQILLLIGIITITSSTATVFGAANIKHLTQICGGVTTRWWSKKIRHYKNFIRSQRFDQCCQQSFQVASEYGIQ